MATKMEDKVIQLLQEQNQLLRQLLAAPNSSKLGWSENAPDYAQKIYVGRNGDSCVYWLDKEDQRHPMKERSITGFVTDLVVDEVVRRDKETKKLNVTIRTDENTYIISGGLDTFYAKSLLTSFAAMDTTHFARPITLSFSPGKDASVVWVRVYAPDYVRVEVVKDKTSIEALVETAISKVKGTLAAISQSTNVIPFSSPNGLFPQHDTFIKKLRKLSGISVDWIVKECSRYNGALPSHLKPDDLKELITTMACESAVKSGSYYDYEKAKTAFISKVEILQAAGKKWGEGAVAFFESINHNLNAS